MAYCRTQAWIEILPSVELPAHFCNFCIIFRFVIPAQFKNREMGVIFRGRASLLVVSRTERSFLAEAGDKPAILQFLDEAGVYQLFGIQRRGLGVARRHFLQDDLITFDRWVGILRHVLAEPALGMLQHGAVFDPRVLAQD